MAITKVTSSVLTAAQPNITSVGTLTGLDVAGTPTFDGLTVDGTADISSNITVGTLDTIIAENNIRFKPTGAVYIDHNTVGQDINFRVSNASTLDTTALVIKSSGELLVGKTTADNTTVGIRLLGSSGFGSFVRDGNTPVVLNRLTSDGEILRFDKDGSTVGSIGVVSGNNLKIHSTQSGHSGVSFGTGIVYATDNAGDATNGATSLGSSSYRWEDLYLSGNVNVNAGQGILFGGAAGASGMTSQVLDDYEEGTWTPGFGGATLTTATGHYTKIGNQVTVHYHIVSTGGMPTSSAQVQISGLPFTIDSNGAGAIYARYYTPNDSTLTTILVDGDSFIRLININEQNFDYTVYGELEASANNSVDIRGTATYKV